MSIKEDIHILLSEPLSGKEVRQLANSLPVKPVFEMLYDTDIRVARNAGWVLMHMPISQIKRLPQEQLIDFAMSTPDSSLRRFSLRLVDAQGMAKDEMRTDFLDFCLQHMVMLEEPPGVQSLCMKLAYRMCLFYPDLLHEFEETLKMMPSEHYKPGVRYLIKKLKE